MTWFLPVFRSKVAFVFLFLLIATVHPLFAKTSVSDWVELSIDYQHRGWGALNLSYVLKHKDQKVLALGKEFSEERIHELLDALADLRPSDGFKQCIAHTDDNPSFKLVLKEKERTVEISSDSNCESYAPWNVVLTRSGGRSLFVQFNGKIGRALASLLQQIDPVQWMTQSDEPFPFERGSGGMVDLIAGYRPPDGVQTGPAPGPRYLSRVLDSQAYRTVFGSRKASLSHLYCFLAEDPNCESPRAEIEVSWKKWIRLSTVFDVSSKTPEPATMSLPRAEDIDALLGSKLVGALNLPKDESLWIQFSQVDCTRERALMDYLTRVDPQKKLTTCDLYYIPPSIFYYPAYRIAWMRSGDPLSTAAYYRRLGASMDLIQKIEKKQPVSLYTTLEGKITELP